MLLTPVLNVCLLVMLHLLLLQSGDVESNPGPFGEKCECKLLWIIRAVLLEINIISRIMGVIPY